MNSNQTLSKNKNGISVDLHEKSTGIGLIVDSKELLSPFKEQPLFEFLKTMKDSISQMPVEELESQLNQQEEKYHVLIDNLLSLGWKVGKIQSTLTLLRKEMDTVKELEGIKDYLENSEKLNRLEVRESTSNGISFYIQNAVYTLWIRVLKYSNLKNYQITGFLLFNNKVFCEYYEGHKKDYPAIDMFDSKSFSEIDKVIKYIQNKFKKYAHLFHFHKAILEEHVDEFTLEGRILNECQIKTFKEADLKLLMKSDPNFERNLTENLSKIDKNIASKQVFGKK